MNVTDQTTRDLPTPSGGGSPTPVDLGFSVPTKGQGTSKRWALPIHPPYGEVTRPVLRTKDTTRLTIDPTVEPVEAVADEPVVKPGLSAATVIGIITSLIITAILAFLFWQLFIADHNEEDALAFQGEAFPPATIAPSEPMAEEGTDQGGQGEGRGNGNGEGGIGGGSQGGSGGAGSAGGSGGAGGSDQASREDGGSQGGLQDGQGEGQGEGGRGASGSIGQGSPTEGKGPHGSPLPEAPLPEHPEGEEAKDGSQGGSNSPDQGGSGQGGANQGGSQGGGQDAPANEDRQGQAVPTPREANQLDEPAVNNLDPFMTITLMPIDAHDQGAEVTSPQAGMVEQRNTVVLKDGRRLTVIAFRGTGSHERLATIVGDTRLDVEVSYGHIATQQTNPRLIGRMGADGQLIGVIIESDDQIRVNDLEAIAEGLRFNFG